MDEENKQKVRMKLRVNGVEREVYCDDFLLVAWNERADGGAVAQVDTSSPEHPDEMMMMAIKVLINAMRKSGNPLGRAMGELLHNVIEQGPKMLEEMISSSETTH